MRKQAERCPALPLAFVLAFAVGACGAARQPTPPPPPAEAYSAFAPVELKVRGQPDWLAAGFGSVWVKREDGMVSRIDPATATVSAEIEADTTSPENCNGIGIGADAIWSCSFQDLVRLDPETNQVAATYPAGKVHGQGRLVQAAGRIWALAGQGDQLVGVAEADGSLSAPITLPAVCNDLGAAADIVYAVCEGTDRVLRIDPTNATVTADVSIPGPASVSAASSGVWIAAQDGLLRLDPTSLATMLTVDGVVAGWLEGIHADDTGVWVHRFDPFLTRIDAATGAQTRVISAPFENGGDVLVDGAYLWVSDPANVVLRLEIPPGA